VGFGGEVVVVAAAEGRVFGGRHVAVGEAVVEMREWSRSFEVIDGNRVAMAILARFGDSPIVLRCHEERRV
jgi:hypothetical protein